MEHPIVRVPGTRGICMDGIGDGFIMFRDACIVRERIIKDDRFDSRSYKRLIYTLKNIYID